jgi:hypothetical protein
VSSLQKVQSISVDYEELADATYNYFARFEVLDGTSNTSLDGHMEFNFDSSPQRGGAVVEFDVKTDAYCHIPNHSYGLTTSSSNTRTYVVVWGINENKLVIHNGQTLIVDPETGERTLGAGSIEVAKLQGQWVHVAMVYQFTQNTAQCPSCNKIYNFESPEDECPGEECTQTSKKYIIRCRTYFGNTDIYDWHNAIDVSSDSNFTLEDTATATYYRDSYIVSGKTGTAATFHNMRFGFTGVNANTVGMSYCLDNFLLYRDLTPTDEEGNIVDMQPVDDIDDVDKYGYGRKVNENATKTVAIKGGEGAKDYIGTGVIMKIGSDYMLNKNKREPIFVNQETGAAYGAPVKKDGIVYVPFEPFLSATGYPVFVHDDGVSYDISTAAGSSTITLNRDVAVINGKRVTLTAAPMVIKDPDDETNT